MGIVIKTNNVTLPSPVSITVSDEIIWSENTGRSATGEMIGDVIAQKETFNIQWGVMPKSDFNTIKANLLAGFTSFSIIEDGVTHTIQQYRGTLTRDIIGSINGVTYYKNVQVSVIQQ